jgi:uncharacterized lipoprotein YddW (UPF0748 family)
VQSAQPVFRGYWVDTFNPGIFTEGEIDRLVADAKAANMNAIVVEVGRRGDCFCNRAIMPRTQASIAPYPFDPLDALIAKAHAEGLQVHAWITATAIWSDPAPPVDPAHVFNTHGPMTSGADNWIALRSDGADRGGRDYYLDPGHPDAADYIVRMYTSVATYYDVDGINLDRIRYPDYNLGINVPSWGYNPVAVRRFQAAIGRNDVPSPTDPEWMQWRRDQITNIVRRVYLETYAIKPRVRVSADTITYGDAPQSQGGWERTRAYAEVLQDWRGWMEEGIIDLNIAMNYRRDHLATDPNNERRMFDEWAEYLKDHQYRRHSAIGSALFLNSIDASLKQIRAAFAPSASGNLAHGWVGFSYSAPERIASPATWSAEERRAELTRAFTQPGESVPATPPVFASPAPPPDMPWKTRPTTGHLRGTVATREGAPFDQVRIDLYDAESHRPIGSRVTDGSGWFGFVDLSPGRYELVVDLPATRGGAANTDVASGRVTTVSLTLSAPAP